MSEWTQLEALWAIHGRISWEFLRDVPVEFPNKVTGGILPETSEEVCVELA